MAKQYVQQPYKVQAEQWDAAADPLQAGVCVCSTLPPHVHLVADGSVWMLEAGDWIYQDLFHPEYQVMPDAEFSAKFGGGA
jgi:hypothetical protein